MVTNTEKKYYESKGYWEKVSPFIDKIPYLGNVAVLIYQEESQKENYTYFDVSERIKDLAYEHAEYLIQLRQKDPDSNLLKFVNQGFEIDWDSLGRLVTNEREKREKANEPIPVFELATVLAGNSEILEIPNNALLGLDDLKKFVNTVGRGVDTIGDGFKYIINSDATAHIIQGGLLLIGTVLEFASDNFVNLERALKVFGPDVLSATEKNTILPTILLSSFELLGLKVVSLAISDIKKGKFGSGIPKLLGSTSVMIMLLTGLFNTIGFWNSSWPELWSNNLIKVLPQAKSFTDFVRYAGIIFLALATNYGPETYVITRGLLGGIPSDTKDRGDDENDEEKGDNNGDGNGDGNDNPAVIITGQEKVELSSREDVIRRLREGTSKDYVALLDKKDYKHRNPKEK